MKKGIPCGMPFFALAAVFILLVAVLILVAVLVAVLILILSAILIAILVIHNISSRFSLRCSAFYSLPIMLGFILSLKYQADDQTGRNCGGNSTGAGSKTTGKDADETVLIHGFLYPFSKCISKTG